MSAINKILVPEMHKDVLSLANGDVLFLLGDLDYKASLASDNGDFSNLATNELLILLPASRLEILQLSWEVSKLNRTQDLLQSVPSSPATPTFL